MVTSTGLEVVLRQIDAEPLSDKRRESFSQEFDEFYASRYKAVNDSYIDMESWLLDALVKLTEELFEKYKRGLRPEERSNYIGIPFMQFFGRMKIKYIGLRSRGEIAEEAFKKATKPMENLILAVRSGYMEDQPFHALVEKNLRGLYRKNMGEMSKVR